MPNAAPELLFGRFREDIGALISAGHSEKPVFAVAVSGGPDSMALLWLATRAFPGQVLAATVDHGLRPEARAEAEMVANWCAQAGIPHAILSPVTPITGSLQAAARAARYDLLRRWREEQGGDWLLTAHHADDQLETLLMRLNRSSGVGGLAGVRARNGAVLRPLLGWRRAELAEIVAVQRLPHVHDPSNRDERYDRVAMRNRLADVDWIDPLAAARSAAACADAEDAIGWVIDRMMAEHVHKGEGETLRLDRHDFPREIQRRLLARMIALLDPGAASPRGETLDQALVQLFRGKKATIGRWLLSGGEVWTVCPAPPRSR
ncbi:MAG: tRNA lysidine(34) synthetase TilS [Sphingobium sp.]